jgi:hypothetical protein
MAKKIKKQKKKPIKYDSFVMQFGFEYPDRTIPRPKKRQC